MRWAEGDVVSDEPAIGVPAEARELEIHAAFADGFRHRPDSTFGTVNADVLEHDDPNFRHVDFVDVILNSSWPE